MALIAIKKDKDFLRVAVATNMRGARRIQFDRALSVELHGETEELSPARLGDKLRAILEKVGVQRGEATVIVDRNDVEMRQFQLPPVPDDELPDMVRFQARNHFASFTEDSLIDFIPLSRTPEHSTVLAVALSADRLQRIRDIVEPAGLKLRHVVVRPFAAAELVRAANPSSKCRVILEIIGREADISVVDNNYILMTRTARVPDSYTVEQFDAWLPGEIRRTIASAQGQSGAPEVEEIIVCGIAAEHEQLSKDLKESFQIDTRFFQPFESIQRSSKFEQPAHHDGFASLLGSLLQSNSEESHAIDFLNPRKKPEKKVNRQKIYMGAGIAAAAALIGLFLVWWILGNQDAQIAKLEKDNAAIRVFTVVTDETIDKTTPLDNWKSQQTNWLEELYRLSEVMPDPEQTRIGRFSATSSRTGSSIDIRGLLKNSTMRDLKDRLESRPYAVQPSDDPTREGGFDREYRVGLDFPLMEITPHGVAIPFYEKTEQEKKEAAEASESTEEDSRAE